MLVIKDKKELTKIGDNVEKLYYLTLDVASYIHLFCKSEKAIRDIFKDIFTPAFMRDIDKAFMACGSGTLSPYVEIYKKGWVPFVSNNNTLSICFRNRGIKIGSDYSVSGESKIKCSDTTFFGNLGFHTEVFNNDKDIIKMRGWHQEDTILKCDELIFGQENRKHPADAGIPYLIMLLLHYIDYSPWICEEYALLEEIDNLKENSMEVGEKLFELDKQKVVMPDASSWESSIGTSIEMPERICNDRADQYGDPIGPVLNIQTAFIGEHLSCHGGFKKNIEDMKEWFFNWDYSSFEITEMNHQLNSAIKELQEIRQLMAGFVELNKSKIMVASL